MNPVAHPLDPLDVNQRLYRQIARLLDDLEDADNKLRVTLPQRISAMIAIGRIQVIFKGLRAESHEPDNVGSAVKRYARTFKKNAARGRTAYSGRRRAQVVDIDDADAGDDDDAA